MEDFLQLASSRRSIRKFENKDIPDKDIEYFIKAAVSAPSGCNSQCWNFVAVRNREIIGQIEAAVIERVEGILSKSKQYITPEYLSGKKKMVSFFSKAPVVIAVFMTDAAFYDPVFISALKDCGYNNKSIKELFSSYDLLSIGASIQNMLLAVCEKGYGACWMNEPAVAGGEINEILGIPKEQKFISLVPIGVPAYMPRSKKMKTFDDVFSVIE